MDDIYNSYRIGNSCKIHRHSSKLIIDPISLHNNKSSDRMVYYYFLEFV